ncbi:uncharacterized protein [Epargyreus clarus]|uniref:uncharacterized protein isoform X2 n=1 Tax=Epargyreus clarus TaxID=520877 RepID=UPI003C2AFC33
MKLLVLCVIIVANVSYNGKASLESFMPTANVLLADTTKNSDKSCQRPCKFNVKPRRCVYDFDIEPAIQENDIPAIMINGMTPGPPIHVCLNDVVIVKVKNKVPDQDLAMHWHGVEQKGTPYMDGVPMVTQCPVSYGSTYEYAFIASTPGTFFYHSNSVAHQSDGVYGSIIVDQPQPLEPHVSLYDYDRGEENTLMIAAKFPSLLTGIIEDLSQVLPTSLAINGNEDRSKLFVIPGYAYRLRLINAAAIECPLLLNVDRHDMMVIATDGKPVKPVSTRHVLLYPGERMDVVVRADQEAGGYWVRVHGRDKCSGLSASAMLLYSGFNYTAMLDEEPKTKNNLEPGAASIIYGQKLQYLRDSTNAAENVKSVYLGIDRNTVKFKDSDNDYRYLSDALPTKPFYPAELSTSNGVIQINGKNFLYPNTPMLLKPMDVKPDSICKVGEEEKHKQTQCVQVLKVEDKGEYELALVNEGFGSNDSYTFHLHGYSAEVIATWQNPNNLPISREDFHKLDKEGKIIRNERNAPLKDTFTVPNKGFTIIRIQPDRGGTWLLECRSCGLSSLPVAVIINVPLAIPKLVVDSLPKCGNYKPADVLLN